MVERQGLCATLQGERREQLLLEPWEWMGLCSPRARHGDARQERQLLQDTEARLHTHEQGPRPVPARGWVLECESPLSRDIRRTGDDRHIALPLWHGVGSTPRDIEEEGL